MRSKPELVAFTALLFLPMWAIAPSHTRATGTHCLSAGDTAAIAINMVKGVVTSATPRDSVLRASLGIHAAADSDVVLVVDEAKCKQAVDTLNAEATRYGGPGIVEGIYLVSTGSEYAAYAPSPGEATGLTFLDAQFLVLGRTVVP